MDITVYGDSILKGVRWEGGRYLVDREWEQILSRQLGQRITNRARFGCTLRKGLAVIRPMTAFTLTSRLSRPPAPSRI